MPQEPAESGKTNPTVPDKRLGSILDLPKQGREQEPVRLLSDALRQDPANQPMNALLAQISFSQKDYPNAVAHFSKAPAVLTARPLLAVNYAEALLETHSVDAATMLCSEHDWRVAALEEFVAVTPDG